MKLFNLSPIPTKPSNIDPLLLEKMSKVNSNFINN